MFDKMNGESVTFVKAVMDFFGTGKHARKIDIPEFQAFTQQDKVELRELLILEGYNVRELATA